MERNSVKSGNEPNQGGRDDEKTMPPSAPNEDAPARKRPNPRMSQRRTKTGCLTCRQRRIKCGEERPICANCIKSKRKCEGYNPRVIFKDPLNMYRGPTSSIPAHSGFIAKPGQQRVVSAPYAQFPPLQAQSQTLLPNILPRTQSFQSEESSNSFLTTQFQGFVYNDRANFQSQQNIGVSSSHGPNPESHGSNEQLPAQWQNHPNVGSAPYQSSGQHSSSSPYGTQSHGSVYQEMYPAQTSLPNPSYFPNHHVQIPPNTSGEMVNPNISSSEVKSGQKRPWYDQPTQTTTYSAQQIPESKQPWIQMPHPPSSIPHEPIAGASFYSDERNDMTNLFDEQEEEEDEDDPYDVSSDEDQDLHNFEYGLDPQSRAMRRRERANNNLATVMAVQAAQDSQNTRIRTYHSVIENYGPNMLANYYPSSRDSPLSDPVAASIFCHFINVIAPGLSMYERHPANPSLLFQGQPVPKSQQHMWAYTMPTIALRNHALLHAMLAMASLHIAKLQNTSIMASLKHYHLAIRRLAKDVGLPTRRKQLATLATTLLLGYYEVMSADHSKWCDHLLGAHQLIKQIDFAGMTKYLKAKKARTSQSGPGHLYGHSIPLGVPSGYQDEFAEGLQHSIEDDIDENFVGILMGKRLRYAEYGQILEDTETPNSEEKKYTKRDLDIFETQRDLFWWYTKQDALQSILSQNRLFLSYDRWSHCPPRAPVGRRDAVHGTFDHLVLLLGRLAEFAAKDLKRKKKVVQANGGHWRPPPGMQMPGPPPNVPGGPMRGPPGQGLPGQGPPGYGPSGQGIPGQGPPGQGIPGQGPPGYGPPGQGPPGQGPPISMIPTMPSFAGMIPTTGKATLPRGFSPTDQGSPTPSSEDDDSDGRLDDQTAKAEEEWLEIRSAFTMLVERFGPDFEPLGPEYVQAIQSPFGPAIQYRTYSIAVIWIMYYMGVIICHRAHPSMPPAAMVAAGIAARQTAFFANEIGRIAAGVAPDATTATSVNIGTGAGLTDSSFALFVAGVQLQHPEQRAWIIQRMLGVERLTGWETASQCAKGCETSWIRAAEMGRGPPYTRYAEQAPVSDIWNRAGQRIDRMLASVGETTHVHPQDTAISGRVQFAHGLIGVEEELGLLELQSDDEDGDGDDKHGRGERGQQR